MYVRKVAIMLTIFKCFEGNGSKIKANDIGRHAVLHEK
jgi:hypothetical protein